MQLPPPLTKDVVLIGGGHAHALFLRRWGMVPVTGVRLTLIDPAPVAPYTGMLPGFVAGHYQREELDIDLVRLARFAGARLLLEPATGIDRATQRVRLRSGLDVAYDLVSIDVGITSAMADLPGFAEHAIAAKPLGPFATRWQEFIANQGTGVRPIAVIGGGVAGVELALAMAHRITEAGGRAAITVVEAADAIAGTGPRARQKLLAAAAEAGITVLEQAPAAEVDATGVRLADGRLIEAAFVVGAAGARPYPWLSECGLATTNGFVDVGPTLQSSGDPAIFAVGDCAHMTATPRPKAGVFAVRQAPVLYHNMRAAVTCGAMQPFSPQRDFLKLISLGQKSALADKFGRAFSGQLMWRWKDRIDRAFMDQFRNYPDMNPIAVSGPVARETRELLIDAPPICGGCGAKVGGDVLAAITDNLDKVGRSDVLRGAGDDAAILAHGTGQQVITTDHLRGFSLDPVLMARTAAIHALGDIHAMAAAPQAVLASIILPPMSDALQRRTLDDIMTSAGCVFAASGAAIVGGHTSIGAELTIGFTITGLVEKAIGNDGATVGDALILTKPLGTGTLLAAEMAGKLDGRHMPDLIAALEQEQGQAAKILSNAHAMTDVTGFGLAGHLWEMMRRSGTSADVTMSAIPVLPGAIAACADGIRASLFSPNQTVASQMDITSAAAHMPLLFDPQTSGGLLASVPAKSAEAAIQALLAAGYVAACIGSVAPGPSRLRIQ